MFLLFQHSNHPSGLLLGSYPGASRMQNLLRKVVSIFHFVSIIWSFYLCILVTTLLNVMSMYHDTLLARVAKANPSYRPLIPSSLHTRFTKAWSDKDSLYKWAARFLEIIRFTELVIEMGLRRKVSDKTKWRSIIILETIK